MNQPTMRWSRSRRSRAGWRTIAYGATRRRACSGGSPGSTRRLRGTASAALPLVGAAAKDLLAHRGHALVVAGESLPPAAHAASCTGSTRASAHARRHGLLPIAGDLGIGRASRSIRDPFRRGHACRTRRCAPHPRRKPGVRRSRRLQDFSRCAATVCRCPVHVSLYEDEISSGSGRGMATFPRRTIPRGVERRAGARRHGVDRAAAGGADLWRHLGPRGRSRCCSDDAAEPASRDLVMRAWRGGSTAKAWRAALRDGVIAASADGSAARPLVAREVDFKPMTAAWRMDGRRSVPDAAVHAKGAVRAERVATGAAAGPESKLGLGQRGVRERRVCEHGWA